MHSLPPAPTRQSSRASSISVRTSSTISCWQTASPAPPPLHCPRGAEPRPTPAWPEATHPSRPRPQLPTSSLQPLLSFHTTALPSTTITTTSTTTINISPLPTPHLLLPSPRSQPCCSPPCILITPLRNNTRCEPGNKGREKEKKMTKSFRGVQAFKIRYLEVWEGIEEDKLKREKGKLGDFE